MNTHRVIIEGVRPEIDCGRFPIKRVIGETVTVEVDAYADGHDEILAFVWWRSEDETRWHEAQMQSLGDDRWRGSFAVERVGRYRYTLAACIDRFATWRHALKKKLDAGQDIAVDLLVGAALLDDAAARAADDDRATLRLAAQTMRGGPSPHAIDGALDETLRALVDAYPDRDSMVTYDRELDVVVDRERARFSSWYELFPRSTATEAGAHGTLRSTAQRLDYVASMGFDVVYLAPIHPIGQTNRKGPNNDPAGRSDSVGSPWAIGSEEGGHDTVHPDLGSIDDFDALVQRARELDMEVALDLAFQCSPDHPWVHKHPEWFLHRPDGSIQFAENPPKKYEDIYPINFETPTWRELWDELRGVVEHWIEHGVRIFRVDNPHTKPFAFWQWLIDEVKRNHPDVIFLSEAFTRPTLMYRLAKLGFTQSYTYFAWRTTTWELTQYFTELTQTDRAEFFRPNLWPNTPDILTEQLQHGGRAAFLQRFVLAATLGASYGIYGPAFELGEHVAIEPGNEEYAHSEKYQVRHWDIAREDSIRGLIETVNRIRRANPALHTDRTLRFHHLDNDALIAYSKRAGSNVVLTVVNLDPHHTQSGWVHLPLYDWGIEAGHPFYAIDMLTNARYTWQGEHNYVELNPHAIPAHILRICPRPRDERDYEYFA